MRKPDNSQVIDTSGGNVFSGWVRPLAAVAIFIGGCVLSGYTINPAPWAFLPGIMRANTSLACLLGGISLWLLQKGEVTRVERFVRDGCAVVVALIGLLTLAEHATGMNLKIDELIGRDVSGVSPHPGRVFANTAFNYALFGIGLWLSSRRSTKAHQLAQLLALITLFVSLCSVTAQIYGAKLFPLVGVHANSVTVLVSFQALAFGIRFSRANSGLMSVLASRTLAGTIGRRLVFGSAVSSVGLAVAVREGQRAGFYDAPYREALSAVADVLINFGLGWYGTREGAT